MKCPNTQVKFFPIQNISENGLSYLAVPNPRYGQCDLQVDANTRSSLQCLLRPNDQSPVVRWRVKWIEIESVSVSDDFNGDTCGSGQQFVIIKLLKRSTMTIRNPKTQPFDDDSGNFVFPIFNILG